MRLDSRSRKEYYRRGNHDDRYDAIVMVYGEHTGQFLAGGGVTPGESFDAEKILIQYTRTINPKGSGYLLGHPSHRGHLRDVKCNHNYMETNTTSIEPNFQLDGYEVIDNIIKSNGHAIHCWRKSINGRIEENIRIDDNTGKPWSFSERLVDGRIRNVQFSATTEIILGNELQVCRRRWLNQG